MSRDLINAAKGALPWLSMLGDYIGNGVIEDRNKHGVLIGENGRCDTILALKEAIKSAEHELVDPPELTELRDMALALAEKVRKAIVSECFAEEHVALAGCLLMQASLHLSLADRHVAREIGEHRLSGGRR